MQNLNDNAQENVGALARIYYAPVSDILFIPPAWGSVINDAVVFVDGKAFYEIEKTWNTSGFAEKSKDNDAGELFEVSASLFFAGDSDVIRDGFNKLINGKYIVLVKDNNGRKYLLGTLDNPVSVRFNYDTKDTFQSRKGYSVVFSYTVPAEERPPFYQSTFPVDGGTTGPTTGGDLADALAAIAELQSKVLYKDGSNYATADINWANHGIKRVQYISDPADEPVFDVGNRILYDSFGNTRFTFGFNYTEIASKDHAPVSLSTEELTGSRLQKFQDVNDYFAYMGDIDAVYDYIDALPPSGILLTDLSAISPIDYDNSTGVFSMHAADSTHNGYLTSAYFDIFNGKQDAIGYTPYNATNPAGYISTITGISAGGDLTGTYPNPSVNWANGYSTLDGRYLTISAYNAGQHFRGKYTSLSALNTAVATANDGDYAIVDAGSGSNAQEYIWDTNEGWVLAISGGGTVTSVFGRVGAVVATSGDYSIGQITNGLSNSLASANIFVGNGSGIATGVSMSGDSTISNTGTVTNTGIRGKSITLSPGLLKYDGTNWGWDTNTYLTTVSFSSLTGKPTTVSGYGITDAWIVGGQTLTANDKLGSTNNVAWDAVANNTTVVRFTPVASAIDYLQFSNGSASTSPRLEVAGSSTDINLDIVIKGTSGYLNLTKAGESKMRFSNTSNAHHWTCGIGGGGITSAGTFFISYDSSTTTMLTMDNGGQISINGTSAGIGSSSANGFSVKGVNSVKIGIATSSSGAITSTSGTKKILSIWDETNNSFQPSSGSANFIWMLFNGTINQTGSATGYTRLIDFSNITYTSTTGEHAQIYSNLATATNRSFIDAGSAKWKTQGVIFQKNASPETGITDNFQMYASDIVSGNSAPFFKTENGDIVKIYSVAGWGTPSGTLDRSTYTVYSGTTMPAVYDSFYVQVLDDHVLALSKRVAALITDLKTGHQLLKA